VFIVEPLPGKIAIAVTIACAIAISRIDLVARLDIDATGRDAIDGRHGAALGVVVASVDIARFGLT